MTVPYQWQVAFFDEEHEAVQVAASCFFIAKSLTLNVIVGMREILPHEGKFDTIYIVLNIERNKFVFYRAGFHTSNNIYHSAIEAVQVSEFNNKINA